jgi:AraC-like DNA-binding protein
MLLFISLSTVLVSLILAVFNWRVNKNALYLSLAFICISVYGIAHYFTLYGKNAFWLAIFYNHFSPANLLVGPFLYFYVRGTLTDRTRLLRSDWLHFLPAVVHLLGITPWLLMPFQEKMTICNQIIQNIDQITEVKTNIIFTPAGAYVIRPLLFLSYTLYSLKLLWQFAPNHNRHLKIPFNQLIISYRWLLVLLITMALLSLNYTILTFQFLGSSPSETLVHSKGLHAITGGILVSMALALLFFPQVLYGMPNFEKKTLTEKSELEKTQDLPSQEEVLPTESGKNPFEELAVSIQVYLEKEKPYTQPDFSIETMARDLKVPLNHMSYCLNEIMGIKFTALRQKARVDHAKLLLKTDSKERYTIEAIAHQSGFSTRSSFYNAFKAETGITPTEFLAKEG